MRRARVGYTLDDGLAKRDGMYPQLFHGRSLQRFGWQAGDADKIGTLPRSLLAKFTAFCMTLCRHAWRVD